MSQLCLECQALQINDYTHDTSKHRLETLAEKLNKQNECALCFLFVKALELFAGESFLQNFCHDRVGTLDLYRQPRNGSLHRMKVDTHPNLESDRLKMSIESQSCFTGWITRVVEPSRPLSEQKSFYRPLSAGMANFGILRGWLDLCEKLHGEHCSDPKWLHVARPEGLIVINVHRRQIVNAAPDCRYAALSYVWGKMASDEHVSTQTDLQQLPRRILGPEKMPKTIEDAIQVTKNIGLDFLWVDAICIAQHPFENADKTHHLFQMDLIYKSAEVVIAAVASVNAENGFLPESDRHRESIIQSIGNLSFAVAKPQFHNYIETTTWASRAWTFQENMLARRLILIGAYETYWLCQCSQWSESEVCEPDAAASPSELKLPDTSRPPRRVLDLEKEDFKWNDPDEIQTFNAYTTLISTYTMRQLGRPEDGIHAVWGILKMLQKMDPSRWDPMYFGLPAVFFDVALLWAPKFTCQRAKSLRLRQILPSWSWAGWLGDHAYGVHWDSSHFEFNQDVNIIPAIRWYFIDESGRSIPLQTVERIQNEWTKIDTFRRPCGLGDDVQPDLPPDRADLSVTHSGYHLHFLTTTAKLHLGPPMYHYHKRGLSTVKERAPYALLDDQKEFAGSILLTDDEADAVNATSLPIEVVCLSYGEMAEPEATGHWLPPEERVVPPPGTFRWHDHGYSDTTRSGKFDVINAMWIQRFPNGVAERVGLAKVLDSAWLKSNPCTEWIVLG